MATKLSNRVELVHAFYRLTGLSGSDGRWVAHQTAASDTLYTWLYQAMREAQAWYLNNVDPARWKKATTSEFSWSGTEAANGGRYMALPSDFLRLFGDQENSALRYPSGERWGHLIDPNDRVRWGDYYWIENDNLWICRGASPPATLVMDYSYAIPQLTDDTTAPDFPEIDRDLIAAEMAAIAADHPSFPGSEDLRRRIYQHRESLQKQVYIRGRRSREPRKIKAGRVIGSHWFVTGR